MSICDRFDEQEWKLVRHVPVDAFISVAYADGTPEQGELDALFDVMLHANDIADPLLRATIDDLGQSNALLEELQEHASWTKEKVDGWAQSTKRLLKGKLSPAEYQSFVCSVELVAEKIARGSGKGPGTTSPEAGVLKIYIQIWEVDPRALRELPGLDVPHPWLTGSLKNPPNRAMG